MEPAAKPILFTLAKAGGAQATVIVQEREVAPVREAITSFTSERQAEEKAEIIPLDRQRASSATNHATESDAADTQDANEEAKKAVPLLMQYRIKELDGVKDEAERLKIEMNIRPDVASLDDYANRPVDGFGEALLRGMGWSEGKPIGLNNKGLVEPIEFKKRPGERLGLGAKPMATPDFNVKRKNRDETLAEAQDTLRGRGERSERSRDERSRDERSRDERSRDERKERQWIAANLSVRVVSKSFYDGKYFKEKGIVLDVPQPCIAKLRMPSGRVLDNVPQRYLETVIPVVGANVLIVGPTSTAPHYNQAGVLMAKDMEKQRGGVMIDDEIVSFSLDDICHVLEVEG
jgi:hypothetical protein